MKSSNKLQARIFSLSQLLPNINADFKAWAFENSIEHIGFRTKNRTCCLSCGHQYKGDQTVKREVCPSCARKLTITTTRKRNETQRRFVTALDVVEEFQVVRFYELRVSGKGGWKPEVTFWEIMQEWMTPDGGFEMIARNRGGMGWYNDGFHGDMEIRNKRSFEGKYNLCSEGVFPAKKILPLYKRNGFKGVFGWTTPYDMFKGIIDNSKAETLLKAGQIGLLAKLLSSQRSNEIYRYWDSIKICMRNSYIVPEAKTTIWLDYIEMLRWFGKDLHNPKYVCPANLKGEHDRLVAIKTGILRRQQEEREKASKELAEMWQKEGNTMYSNAKGAFFGIIFREKDITIEVLKSIEDFIAEEKAHGHCVYASEYYKKPDSLIFSAKVAGKPAETVEVTLSDMRVSQSRGLAHGDANGTTKYHNQIIKLVRKNMHIINGAYKLTQIRKSAVAA